MKVCEFCGEPVDGWGCKTDHTWDDKPGGDNYLQASGVSSLFGWWSK